MRLPLVLAAALIGSLVTTGQSARADSPVVARFADVEPGEFYADAVDWAQSLGIVSGVVDGCFAPNRSATRAEVAAVLQRLVAPESTAAGHPFLDVHAAWQQVPIAWMAAGNITTGTTPATFSPDQAATRAMIGAFLWRLEAEPSGGAETHPFVDIRAAWQDTAVQWLWSEGITIGRSPTDFAPDEPVTRGELLTLIWRWQGQPDPPTSLGESAVLDCRVATGTCADVFSSGSTHEITALAAGRPITAHVHDHRTGCTYELNPGLEITTASVIKAQILAGVLLDAQDRGGPVSATDNGRIDLMMRFSHNSPPTSALYSAVGGAAGMENLDNRFNLTDTRHTGRYGATITTAADRTRLVEQLLVGGGPLDADRVEDAWTWMNGVSVAQSWGLSAGLPEGHDFALKNGFYPMTGRGWRLGTTGVVRTPVGGTYAVTIMTEGNANEPVGIELVEAVARHINDQLTLGAPAPRPIDSLQCQLVPSGSTWLSVGTSLTVSDLDTLRMINGGESRPLTGQRVCAP